MKSNLQIENLFWEIRFKKILTSRVEKLYCCIVELWTRPSQLMQHADIWIEVIKNVIISNIMERVINWNRVDYKVD